MFSDLLTIIGLFGAIVISIGYALTYYSANFLWLASLGLVINWYGDSLDGTLARVRNKQRPIYGFYLDHTLDCIGEFFIFIGIGLSHLVDMRVALLVYISYLLMTINVTINSHLKSEFKLTYAKLGPTEFRLLAIILNTILVFSPKLRNYTAQLTLFGMNETIKWLDIAGLVIFFTIMTMYIVTVIKDAIGYSKADPGK